MIKLIATSVLTAVLAVAAHAETPAPSDGPSPQMKALLSELHPKTGSITLPAANVTLTLGPDYEFLDAAESRRILTEGWGNPPEAAEGVLGMIFPAGKTFLDDDVWGAVVTYEQTFYVTDEAAKPSDYDKLLTEMRSGEDEENETRKKSGFVPVHLVGWAQPPSYDRARHDLIWARDIRFGANEADTLNYDTRHLGRNGVLSLNIVSTMPHLADIRAEAPKLAATAEFDAGARYADHQKEDKVSGYGLVGLVAAGAGLLVAKKAGLVALILLFAKKGIALIVFAGIAVANWARRLVGKKPVKAPSWIEEPVEDQKTDGDQPPRGPTVG